MYAHGDPGTRNTQTTRLELQGIDGGSVDKDIVSLDGRGFDGAASLRGPSRWSRPAGRRALRNARNELMTSKGSCWISGFAIGARRPQLYDS